MQIVLKNHLLPQCGHPPLGRVHLRLKHMKLENPQALIAQGACYLPFQYQQDSRGGKLRELVQTLPYFSGAIVKLGWEENIKAMH
jgi:hypothetical protein